MKFVVEFKDGLIVDDSLILGDLKIILKLLKLELVKIQFQIDNWIGFHIEIVFQSES